MSGSPKTSGSPTARMRGAAALSALALVLPAGLTIAAGSAQADQTYYVPVSQKWTVNGHGYGHGHGMSQYGAYGAALQGLDYTQILDFYYPGTSWAKARGNVRVLLSSDYTSDVQVRPSRRLTVRDMRDGKQWTLPTGNGVDRWRMTPAPDGSTAVQFHTGRGWQRWHVPDGRETFESDGQFNGKGPLTLLLPSGAAKQFRGSLRIVRPYSGASVRDTVNVLPMDSYVQGVVPYEMPTSWHQQALRSQAVAARTYAAWQRAQNPTRYYQICDTTACQVYGGIGSEQPSSNQAVQATGHQTLAYGGEPAFTQFSASSGGWTSAGGVPYLPAKQDPYDGFSGNAVHDWTTQISASTLERAHPEIGRLVALRVTQREGHGQWGGRALQIKLRGSNGTKYLTGDDFRFQYGLRSSWFDIEPTPIITRWKHLGAGRSPLGSPASGEYALSSGAVQEFDGGRVFWSSNTGARELRGRLLRLYRNRGGPASHLGWPRSGVMHAPDGGYKAKLQGGRIYTKPGPGAHVVFGPILGRWGKQGYADGFLGYPKANVTKVDGGQRCVFQHGTITWHRGSNTFTVRRNS